MLIVIELKKDFLVFLVGFFPSALFSALFAVCRSVGHGERGLGN
jgi:hypothetical protein